jgi:hypothetical protein
MLAQLEDIFSTETWRLLYAFCFGLPVVALIVGILLWRRGIAWKVTASGMFYTIVAYLLFHPWDNAATALLLLTTLCAGPLLSLLLILPLGKRPIQRPGGFPSEPSP